MRTECVKILLHSEQELNVANINIPRMLRMFLSQFLPILGMQIMIQQMSGTCQKSPLSAIYTV